LALYRLGTAHSGASRQTQSGLSITLLGGPGTCGPLFKTALIELEGSCSQENPSDNQPTREREENSTSDARRGQRDRLGQNRPACRTTKNGGWTHCLCGRGSSSRESYGVDCRGLVLRRKRPSADLTPTVLVSRLLPDADRSKAARCASSTSDGGRPIAAARPSAEADTQASARKETADLRPVTRLITCRMGSIP
jgi:hypothetical protein